MSAPPRAALNLRQPVRSPVASSTEQVTLQFRRHHQDPREPQQPRERAAGGSPQLAGINLLRSATAWHRHRRAHPGRRGRSERPEVNPRVGGRFTCRRGARTNDGSGSPFGKRRRENWTDARKKTKTETTKVSPPSYAALKLKAEQRLGCETRNHETSRSERGRRALTPLFVFPPDTSAGARGTKGESADGAAPAAKPARRHFHVGPRPRGHGRVAGRAAGLESAARTVRLVL